MSLYLTTVEFPSFQSKKTFAFKKTALVSDVIQKCIDHLTIKRIPVSNSVKAYGLYIPSKYRKGSWLPANFTLVSLVESGKLRLSADNPNKFSSTIHFKKKMELPVTVKYGKKRKDINVDEHIPLEDLIPSIAKHFGISNSANFSLKFENSEKPIPMTSTLEECGVRQGTVLYLVAPESPTQGNIEISSLL